MKLDLDPRMPAAAFDALTAVLLEFPGQDRLELRAGARRLIVPVRDCPALRRAVKRATRKEIT